MTAPILFEALLGERNPFRFARDARHLLPLPQVRGLGNATGFTLELEAYDPRLHPERPKAAPAQPLAARRST